MDQDHVVVTKSCGGPTAGVGTEPMLTTPIAPVPRFLPLNSKCLTATYLSIIARALELLTKGSIGETRQMIEGKLSDQGRKPANFQVQNKEHDRDKYVALADICRWSLLGPRAASAYLRARQGNGE